MIVKGVDLLIENNFILSIWSVIVFFYYLILTFAIGYSVFPREKITAKDVFYNYFVPWLIGFSILTIIMVVIGTFFHINNLSVIITNILL